MWIKVPLFYLIEAGFYHSCSPLPTGATAAHCLSASFLWLPHLSQHFRYSVRCNSNKNSRWFALAVQLHGAGSLLGKKRCHLLHLAVLHRGKQPLVVFAPLIDLKRWRFGGKWTDDKTIIKTYLPNNDHCQSLTVPHSTLNVRDVSQWERTKENLCLHEYTAQ